jgi:hypothetical protein
MVCLDLLVSRKVRKGKLAAEISICRGEPGISHLLFAHDTLLFFKVVPNQTEFNAKGKEMIDIYSHCIGQLIHQSKCSNTFNAKDYA